MCSISGDEQLALAQVAGDPARPRCVPRSGSMHPRRGFTASLTTAIAPGSQRASLQF
jgi:hypothetical protein